MLWLATTADKQINKLGYQEFEQVLELSAFLVLDRVRLVVALEEIDSGESLYGHALHVHLVRGVIHLRDNDVIVACQLIAQLVPDRGCVVNMESSTALYYAVSHYHTQKKVLYKG